MKIIKELGMVQVNHYKVRKTEYECHICKSSFVADTSAVNRGKITKCNKCPRIKPKSKHGDTGKRLYRIWSLMKDRCANANNVNHKYYGGRGIKVCDDWSLEYIKFKEWALSNGYSDDLTIDRINNDGNYEPNNCRWANYSEQALNRSVAGSIKLRGVSLIDNNRKNKYRASIKHDGKSIHIGCFDSELKAAIAYDNYIVENNIKKIRNFNDTI